MTQPEWNALREMAKGWGSPIWGFHPKDCLCCHIRKVCSCEFERWLDEHKPDDSHNFPASAPVDGTEYDPEGLGRFNTEGWPKHPRPYKRP